MINQESSLINNSRIIKKGWIKKAESPAMKFNSSFIKGVEEWTGETASDYREASDTGIDRELINNK